MIILNENQCSKVMGSLPDYGVLKFYVELAEQASYCFILTNVI